jgi:hypothetical protein
MCGLFFLGKIGGNSLKFVLQIIVVCLLGLNTSHADTWLSLGGGTVHFCQSCAYNDFNPGIGIQKDYSDDLRLIGGSYYNSFYKATFYGGASYQPLQYGLFRFGIMGGVVTNYNNLHVPVMALPAVSIEGDKIGVDILGGPSIGNRPGLITANLKYKL